MSSIGGRSGSFVVPGGDVEVAYVESPNNYSTTATTPGSAPNIFSTDLTIVADGVTPYTIEFYSPEYNVGPTAPSYAYLYLYQDGSLLYQANAAAYADGTYNAFTNAYQKWRFVPTAGTHTYNVRATAALGTVNVNGGVANYPPNYIRACKIVQQNDGFKPFWTPPLVTELPSNPTVGDIVIYAADLTNGVYWNLYYDGIGSYPWKFVGGIGIHSANGSYPAQQGTTSYADVTSGATVTAPLDGDYLVGFSGKADISNPTFGFLNNIAVMTATVAPSDTKAAGIGGQYGGTGIVRQQFHRESKLSGVSAGETIKMQVKQAVGSVQAVIHYTSITATPVRVAG